MIPRLKPDLGWNELVAAFTPPRKNDVERFERAFAEEMGQKNAIAFPYGRTGLVLLLEAMGLTDREVVCPAYTCVVVPHAIVTSGNKPVFVDSQEQDFNMDLELVPQAITERTGAIVATSIFGYPVDLDRLDEIREQYPHIRIIQDCAHSFAAEWKGKSVQKAGDAAIFGLNISKLITSIFGGMITTDDDYLANRLRSLRDNHLKPATLGKSLKRLFYLLAVYPTFFGPIYGLVSRLERSGLLDNFVKYYDDAIIDMPDDFLEMMTKIEARVGFIQISKHRKVIEHRRKTANIYHNALKDRENFQLPPQVEGATYSHYVPRVPERKTIIERALRNNIQLGELIEYSIPEMTAYQKFKYVGGDHAKLMAETTINLPVHCDIDKRAAQRIINFIIAGD